MILTTRLPCLGKRRHHVPSYPNQKPNIYSGSLPFSPSYSLFIRHILLICLSEYTAHLPAPFSLLHRQGGLDSSVPTWNPTTRLTLCFHSAISNKVRCERCVGKGLNVTSGGRGYVRRSWHNCRYKGDNLS